MVLYERLPVFYVSYHRYPTNNVSSTLYERRLQPLRNRRISAQEGRLQQSIRREERPGQTAVHDVAAVRRLQGSAGQTAEHHPDRGLHHSVPEHRQAGRCVRHHERRSKGRGVHALQELPGLAGAAGRGVAAQRLAEEGGTDAVVLREQAGLPRTASDLPRGPTQLDEDPADQPVLQRALHQLPAVFSLLPA